MWGKWGFFLDWHASEGYEFCSYEHSTFRPEAKIQVWGPQTYTNTCLESLLHLTQQLFRMGQNEDKSSYLFLFKWTCNGGRIAQITALTHPLCVFLGLNFSRVPKQISLFCSFWSTDKQGGKYTGVRSDCSKLLWETTELEAITSCKQWLMLLRRLAQMPL